MVVDFHIQHRHEQLNVLISLGYQQLWMIPRAVEWTSQSLFSDCSASSLFRVCFPGSDNHEASTGKQPLWGYFPSCTASESSLSGRLRVIKMWTIWQGKTEIWSFKVEISTLVHSMKFGEIRTSVQVMALELTCSRILSKSLLIGRPRVSYR